MKRLLLSVAIVSIVSGSNVAIGNPLTDRGVSPDSDEYRSAICKKMMKEFVRVEDELAPKVDSKGGVFFTSLEAAKAFFEREEQRADYKRKVASGDIIESNDPYYWRKTIYSYLSSGVREFAKISAPFVLPVGTHLLSNYILDKAGPSLVKAAGTAGGELAVKASAFWTWMDPTGTATGLVRSFGESEGRGEMYRRLGYITDKAEKFGPAIVMTGYQVGTKAAYGFSNFAQSVSGGISGWFGKSKTATAA